MIEPKYCSIKDGAKLTGVSVGSIRRMIKDNRLVAYRPVAGRTVLEISELMAAVALRGQYKRKPSVNSRKRLGRSRVVVLRFTIEEHDEITDRASKDNVELAEWCRSLILNKKKWRVNYRIINHDTVKSDPIRVGHILRPETGTYMLHYRNPEGDSRTLATKTSDESKAEAFALKWQEIVNGDKRLIAERTSRLKKIILSNSLREKSAMRRAAVQLSADRLEKDLANLESSQC